MKKIRYRFCCWFLLMTIALNVQAQMLSEAFTQKPVLIKPSFYNEAKARMRKDFTPEHFSFLQRYNFDNQLLNTAIMDYLTYAKKERRKNMAAIMAGAATFVSGLFLANAGFFIFSGGPFGYILGYTVVAAGGLAMLGSPGVSAIFHIGARKERKKAFYSAMAIARMIPK